MRRPRRLALAVALGLTVWATGAAAQNADRAFATALVAAINARTVEARAALVHRKAHPCITGDVGEWWRESVLRQGRPSVPADSTSTITPLSPDDARAASDRFDWPVTPTHVLQLEVTDAPSRARTLLFRLVQEGGRWVEVVPCAKPETVVAIRAVRAETARRAERAKALAASTWPELRERVLALYRSGNRIDAYKTYARESGEDLPIAREVVDLLAEGDR
jgi:hypothetical protein